MAKQRRRVQQRSANVRAAAAPPPDLDGLWSDFATVFDRVVRELLPSLWDRGWQPADVARVVASGRSKRAVKLLAAAVVEDSRSYEALGHQVAPRWMSQVLELEAGGVLTLDPGRPLDHALVSEAAELANVLASLPRVPILEPPPSAWHLGLATDAPPADVSESLLSKVRNLLAKAESTQFEAEAEAFTAKAQELMTRHRIDRALLDATVDLGDAPAGRRLGVDDPYADAKVMLLSAICDANGARCVWDKGFGFATVFGYPVELDVIEELFTSLLVQSSAALRREGSKTDARGRSRTKAFRRTFLVSFAHRIGERLRDTVETTVSEAGGGDALLPVLAARDAEVDKAIDEAFPVTKKFRASASDAEGWYAGLAFGDRADLSVGAPVERRSAS